MSRLIALALLLCLAACASVPRQRLSLPEPRLAPDAMAMDVSLAQRLSFRRADDDAAQATLDALLEIDARSLRLAGFAAGRRVLMLDWDGVRIDEQRGDQLPEHVRAGRILRDIQFVYAPTATLQAALPQGWRVLEVGARRELRWRGASAIVIDYATMPRWNGAVSLDNRIEGYRLDIESVAAAVESD